MSKWYISGFGLLHCYFLNSIIILLENSNIKKLALIGNSPYELKHIGRFPVLALDVDYGAIDQYCGEVKVYLEKEYNEIKGILRLTENIREQLRQVAFILDEHKRLEKGQISYRQYRPTEFTWKQDLDEHFGILRRMMEELENSYEKLHKLEHKEFKIEGYMEHFIKLARKVFSACEDVIKTRKYLD